MLQDWANFATVTGSAAGALTGLLFVAVSLNRDRIVGHAGLRAEAAQTLVLFLVALLLAVLLVLPGISARTLGVVLVVVALVSGTAVNGRIPVRAVAYPGLGARLAGLGAGSAGLGAGSAGLGAA